MTHQRTRLEAIREAAGSRDPLTGLLNRAAFEKVVHGWVGGGAVARRPASSLVILEIDWTTRSGRTQRPAKKDAEATMKVVAELTSKCLRTVDVVGRYDEDSLALLLPSTPAQQAENVARRIRATVSIRTPQLDVPATISVGVATALVGNPWAAAIESLAAAQRAGGDEVVVAQGSFG